MKDIKKLEVANKSRIIVPNQSGLAEITEENTDDTS